MNKTYKSLEEKFNEEGLWKDDNRTHLIAYEPFSLSSDEVDELKDLGETLFAFYIAFNRLYLHKGNEWINEYLDIGKNEEILRFSRMNFHKQSIPRIIRPDILITDNGFYITELDSVPGGFGHLDFLSDMYYQLGYDLITAPNDIAKGFVAIMREESDKEDPLCAIIVSDESEDYRPEMEFLAKKLRKLGLRVYTIHPRDIHFTDDGLYIECNNKSERIDVIYRFYELFDLLNIPKSELIGYAVKKRLSFITPPYKHFLEEKMIMAFFWNDYLKEFWITNMGEEKYYKLKKVLCPTWILDNRVVQPYAEISGFKFRDKPIRSWRDIGNTTQKERRFVIKPSGFSPLSWGSRGVKIGSDLSQTEWNDALNIALNDFDKSPWIIQPFAEAKLRHMKYLDKHTDEAKVMESRVRLCPYYFVYNNKTNLSGVMATGCPRDKKIIHGMRDAIIAPCR